MNTLEDCQIPSNITQRAFEESTVQITDLDITQSSIAPPQTQEIETQLREYQYSIYKKIERQWFEEKSKFGSIIFMATGSGKTFVAIKLILRIFEKHDENHGLIKRTQAQLQQKLERISEAHQKKRKQGKKVAFIVPTTNLVDQQAESINQYTDLFVCKFSGNHQKSKKCVPGLDQCEDWQNQLSVFDVFVFTEKKLYDVLSHGFSKIEDFDLIVFDECHHADQSHYYNLIMQDFFYFNLTEDSKRPKILGLTASPIKEKVGDCIQTNIDSEIKSKLQNLSNNLYSKFIDLDKQQIQAIEKQNTEIDIQKYDFDLEEKIYQIKMIKDRVISKMCKLLNIADLKAVKMNENLIENTDPCLANRINTQKMDLSEVLELSVDLLMTQEFEKHQDVQVVKFLKKRNELMSIDTAYVKSNIHIQSFKDFSDQILMIFIIIILKNANNLILELGPYSFKRFLQDYRKDLVQRVGQAREPGASKRARDKGLECERILSEFMQQDSEFEELEVLKISRKVEKLVEILNHERKTNGQSPKVIIFVKDRIIAFYLKKILEEQAAIRKENPRYMQDNRLLNWNYVVEMAMGPRGKNLVNKAYKSTKPTANDKNNQQLLQNSTMSSMESAILDDSNLSEEVTETKLKHTKDIIHFRNKGPIFTENQVKMTNNQLNDVIQKFKTGGVNVLIATDVIQEGLDITECNLIICMNEMLNVKAFIQMKGRARQLNSKFIFLCAKQEYDSILKDKQQFAVVIESMKELAFGQAIEPDPNIIEKKALDPELNYFQIPSTGARLSIRDSKLVLDQFCKAASDEPGILMAINEQLEAEERKVSKFVKDYEPNYRTSTSVEDSENRKYFFSCVYLPRVCANYIEDFKVMPQHGFLKKKDSESHVALLAIKQLYANGYFDEYLFPKIGQWLIKKNKQQAVGVSQKQLKKKATDAPQMQVPKSVGQMYQGQGVVRRETVTNQEVQDFKKEQEEFDQLIKGTKSKIFETVESQFRSLIKEKLPTSENQKKFKLFIHCLKDVKTQDEGHNHKFPFKTTRDHLGIIFNRQFDQKNPIKFYMFQEKKQKDKNLEYLKILKDNELISEENYTRLLQDKDLIEIELNKENSVKLTMTMPDAEEQIQRLKFFHTWVFYYFYCADFKFMQHLLKNKFTFSNKLFGPTMRTIYSRKDSCKTIKQIFCDNPSHFVPKYQESLDKTFYPQQMMTELHPYVIPLKENQVSGDLEVNWSLIEKVRKSVEMKLLELANLITPRKKVCADLNLDATFMRKRFNASVYADSSLKEIWDDRFTGVRYVKLSQFQSNIRWDNPLLLLDRRQRPPESVNQEQQFIEQLKYLQQQALHPENQMEVAKKVLNEIQKKEKPRKFDILRRELDIFTVQQYNFEKYGLFLTLADNKFMFKVRKERHFVDFSKTPKQTERDMLVKESDQASTQFDVSQQIIQKSPLSYAQYQVFQQTCTHMLFFNEFLQVERFIRDKFNDLYCFLKPINKHEQQQRLQNRQKLGIDQFISQSKENLQSDMEPDIISRDVFRSPDERDGAQIHSARDQLLNNIDLMLEALTAPNANRNYDYERLEFYGDSVISFLVILELFLTKPYHFKEGDLDFYRIQQVSNMNFFKINKKENFFKYMINEPQTIFNDFVPGAFENLKYQERIKHKTLNEMCNKILELRRIKTVLQRADSKHGIQLSPQMLTEIRMFMNANELTQSLTWKRKRFFDDGMVVSQQGLEGEERPSDYDLIKILQKKVKTCITKIEQQKQTKKNEINDIKKRSLNKRQASKKQFFYKQLADIVESVTGAATVACGLNLTQNYLRQINVLKFDQARLKIEHERLKWRKSLNPRVQLMIHAKISENKGKLLTIQDKLGYEFNDKVWLVEALTHKSYIDQNRFDDEIKNLDSFQMQVLRSNDVNCLTTGSDIDEKMENMMPPDDYERLEFLGDAILNYLIAEHFYKTTVNDNEKKMPKELHKMKTSVINNALLSLIVIENGIHEHILYNNKAASFKEQFEKYVQVVKELLANQEGGSTKTSSKALDLDQLYEYNLKIFGDVFESLIGAIFIDSGSITTTWDVLIGLMEPYIQKYANLSTLQDHSRTKLLELWNQKHYMRTFKCYHLTKHGENENTVFQGMVGDVCVLEVSFDKDAKNKVRSFYRQYYQLISGFFEELENNSAYPSVSQDAREIISFRNKHFKPNRDYE